MKILPQASDVELLSTLLESVALGVSNQGRLAERLDVNKRTVRQYIELARWLGLLRANGRLLSECGRRYVGDDRARRAILRKALSGQPIVERLRDRPDWQDSPVEAAGKVIRRYSSLSGETGRSRAEALVELLTHAGLLNRREARAEQPAVRQRLPAPESLPVEILGLPSSLEGPLGEMEVRKVGGVLEISEADLRRSELSERDLQAMRDLQEAARKLVDASDDRAVRVGSRLVEFGLELQDDWREVLVKLPTRAASGFDRTGFASVGQVLQAEARGDLTRLPGVGSGTAREVSKQLDIIAQKGFDVYLYGPGGKPQTVSALANRMLDSLGEEDRLIMRMRYREGRTFGEIGDHFDLTRQRIRQKTTDYLNDLRDKYGGVAREIVGALAEELTQGVGVIHRSRIRRLSGGDDLYQTLLVVLVLDEDAYIWKEQFIADVPSSTLDREVVADLRRKISDSRRLQVSVDHGLQYADEVGFRFDEEALRDFLRMIWGMDIDSTGTFENRWANKGDRIAQVLYEARTSLDLETIADRYQQDYATEDEAEATPRRVQPFVKKHPHIYTVDNGEYVHRAALPVEEDLLLEVVDWCVDRLKGEDHAVSVNVLLEELESTEMAIGDHLEGLNRYLLRDILLRHSGVTGFHNTFNVAWEESFEQEGVTLLDRVETILQGAEEPISAEDVVERLPSDFDVNPHSVENYLVSEEFSIKIDEHAYMHRENLEMADEEVREVLDAAIDQLPEDGTVVSTPQLTERLESYPEVQDFLQRERAGAILWGLLRHDERVQVGSRWLVALADGDHETLLERAIMDTVEQLGPAYPREIDEALDAEFGFDVRDSRVYRHARELADRGELRRFPNGLYFPTGLSEREVFELLDERSEELRRAAQRADVAKYPTDDLWLLARYLKHADYLEDAQRVLEVLISKRGEDEADEAWLELREELEEAIAEKERRTA